jgi:hypothetical protein
MLVLLQWELGSTSWDGRQLPLPAAPCVDRIRVQVLPGRFEEVAMCRNIKMLFNFEPPATPNEVRASALQFVRKLSGYTHPSAANQAAFDHAVDEVETAARKLLTSLETSAPKRTREEEAEKARARGRQRSARDRARVLAELAG